jgi:hypothetical protein
MASMVIPASRMGENTMMAVVLMRTTRSTAKVKVRVRLPLKSFLGPAMIKCVTTLATLAWVSMASTVMAMVHTAKMMANRTALVAQVAQADRDMDLTHQDGCGL